MIRLMCLKRGKEKEDKDFFIQHFNGLVYFLNWPGECFLMSLGGEYFAVHLKKEVAGLKDD
jgi:hypothetical protein